MVAESGKRFYPAVVEQGPKNSFGAWFPDFPGCVAAGPSRDEAIRRAEVALAKAADALAERDEDLPPATPIEEIVLPKNCKFIVYFIVGVEPPNPSERINIYLPKNLIAQVDARATELGMSRSSFFGMAVSGMFGKLSPSALYHTRTELSLPRSRAHKVGTLHRPKKKKT
jgi:predicted RNase H-like HicB family nuclease